MYRSYNISAIPTKYNGDVFSSRLEARWAIYFNNLGVGYDYEPYYFELPSRNYKPDFWIYDDYSENYFWLEIKPSYPKEFEIDLMEELCLETEECGMIIYGSIPNPAQHLKYGLCPVVGLIYFGTWWEEDEEGVQEWFNGWKTFDGEFLTFNRDFEHVDQALNSAIMFCF